MDWMYEFVMACVSQTKHVCPECRVDRGTHEAETEKGDGAFSALCPSCGSESKPVGRTRDEIDPLALTADEREALIDRVLCGRTLEEIGRAMTSKAHPDGLTRERVRQLEHRATRKLREKLGWKWEEFTEAFPGEWEVYETPAEVRHRKLVEEAQQQNLAATGRR